MIRKSLVIISILVLISSCSTTKQVSNKLDNSLSSLNKKDLKNLSFDGNIIISSGGAGNNISFTMNLAGFDSLELSIYGPLGLNLGKLYSYPDYFLLYNSFNNVAFEGKPDYENMKRAIQLPVSYNDLFHLFRCETFFEPESYIKDESINSEKEILLKRKIEDDGIDYVRIDTKNYDIMQYQRKMKNGKKAIDALLSDYGEYEGFRLARKIRLNLPESDDFIIIEVSNYKINQEFKKPFKFNLPSGVKKNSF